MTQELMIWALGTIVTLMIIIGSLMVALMKLMWCSIKDLSASDKEIFNKISQVEVLVAGDYVRKNELKETADAIFSKISRCHSHPVDGRK